jgi:sulfatase modifying factor 1
MAGNVSEWTVSPYNNLSYQISSTINPYLGNKMNDPMKVVRGGSWKDVGYMLMVSFRDNEHQDSARSYIGFRCVQTIPESADLKLKRKSRLK